jgi:hypothetical protein
LFNSAVSHKIILALQGHLKCQTKELGNVPPSMESNSLNAEDPGPRSFAHRAIPNPWAKGAPCYTRRMLLIGFPTGGGYGSQLTSQEQTALEVSSSTDSSTSIAASFLSGMSDEFGAEVAEHLTRQNPLLHPR